MEFTGPPTTPPQAVATASQRLAAFAQRNTLLVRAAMLATVLTFVVTGLSLWLTGGMQVGAMGYAGVWAFSFIGAASILVPVPGLAAVCVAASPAVGLNPILIGLVAGSAEALGELSGYMAGAGGKGLVQRNRFYPRLKYALERWGGWILLIGSSVPNPTFDVVGVAAGSVSYPVRRFLPIVFIGKTIKSTGVAYGCYYGIQFIESLVHAA